MPSEFAAPMCAGKFSRPSNHRLAYIAATPTHDACPQCRRNGRNTVMTTLWLTPTLSTPQCPVCSYEPP